MKRRLRVLAILLFTAGVSLTVLAGPAEDLAAFQAFFSKKFPDVPLDDFANGPYALPAAKTQREEWAAAMQQPPFASALERGRRFWEANDLASCFKRNGRNIAQHYPYWDERTRMIRTIELDINACLKRKRKPPLRNLKGGTMAEVVAYMKSLSHGQRVKIAVTTPEAEIAYDEGRRFYWARRGQLNLSCANCHVDHAGARYGADILSAGLGHGLGYPAYRPTWGERGTLHRRYAACNKQVGAAAFKPQSRQYRHLEFYETYLQQGLPLTAPSLRP